MLAKRRQQCVFQCQKDYSWHNSCFHAYLVHVLCLDKRLRGNDSQNWRLEVEVETIFAENSISQVPCLSSTGACAGSEDGPSLVSLKGAIIFFWVGRVRECTRDSVMNSVDGTCPTKVIGNCNSRACVNTGFFVYASFRIKNCNHFLAKLKTPPLLSPPHPFTDGPTLLLLFPFSPFSPFPFPLLFSFFFVALCPSFSPQKIWPLFTTTTTTTTTGGYSPFFIFFSGLD